MREATHHPPPHAAPRGPGRVLRASVTVDPAAVVSPVHRRVFGSFVEHMGRCVHTGIREPGHPEPHGIRMWCPGDEMDGPRQTGRPDARSYGRGAGRAARATRTADRDPGPVVRDSSGPAMSTFGQREAAVLEETYDAVDHISPHAYYEERDGDPADSLGSTTDTDRFTDSVVSTADAVGARLRDPERIQPSSDEWNVWYLSRHQARTARGRVPHTGVTAPRHTTASHGETPLPDAVVTVPTDRK